MGERLDRTQEAAGSSPASSTVDWYALASPGSWPGSVFRPAQRTYKFPATTFVREESVENLYGVLGTITDTRNPLWSSRLGVRARTMTEVEAAI